MKAALVSGFFLISACNQLGPSYIEIRNEGGVPLSMVDAQLGGKSYKVDLIKPKGVAKIVFEPVSDSSVRIDYVSQGRKQTCAADVYVTTGPRMRISAAISGKACKVEEIN